MPPDGVTLQPIASDNRGAFPSGGHLFLSLLLLGSMGLNLILGWQVPRLRQHSPAPLGPSASSIVGAKVSFLQVSDLDGRPSGLSLSSQSRPTVLYVLNPRWHWCARNSDNIKSLALNAGGRYRFVGLSLNDGTLKEYAKSHELGFPIYSISSYGVAPSLELGSTPETIVISGDGKVLRAWLGGLMGSDLKEVEAYFAVSLPGLAPETK